ncbi:MAG: NAD(P)/FAD-dependent oxidoreductase [Dissulfurispiraceae bacterium]|jgi:geranylgeranyl reductase|nr:NAD(P)/FAD-dependent oxidoreductase [Dissulfurispiraceae bacterium]
MDNIRTQALVIGGGPAGAAAARRLAEHSISTLLLERDLTYTKPCGGAIPSSAIVELGIPDSVIRNHVTKIKVFSPKGESVSIDLEGGTFCITERHELDSTLRKTAADKGASIIEAEFLRFESRGKQIISVARKRATGEEFRITSDYVIACDGITFRAASSAGLQKPEFVYTISAYLKPDDYSADTCEFWFGNEHSMLSYSWIFPASDFLSVGTGNEDPKLLTNTINGFMERRFNMDIDSIRNERFISKMRAFRIPLWSKPVYNLDNLLFAGDAGYTVMPVSYEGIYYSMRSGQLAADAVAAGNPGQYKKEWNKAYRARFIMMSMIRKHLLSKTDNIEKWILLHQRKEVQELAMRLWLRKEASRRSLLSYIGLFRHIIKIW